MQVIRVEDCDILIVSCNIGMSNKVIEKLKEKMKPIEDNKSVELIFVPEGIEITGVVR